MTEVDELLARVGDDRAAANQIFTLFAEWWPTHDERAHGVLDRLAADAAISTDSLDLLLELVDRHGISRPALRRILISADDVDEAEQSTLAVVAMKVDKYNGTARFTTWLHQVASNEAKMLIRARSRRPSSAVEDPPVAPFVARLSTLLADRDVIERAFAALPDNFRRPLELREIDGLDYDEIAATLDIPIGTVRSRLSRARAMLVESLRVQLPDD
jgi:RNA polymerase sigma-70 factor, ECF subfamily